MTTTSVMARAQAASRCVAQSETLSPLLNDAVAPDACVLELTHPGSSIEGWAVTTQLVKRAI